MTELRTPEQWCAVYGLQIADADGWRTRDAPAWDQPISLPEFAERFSQCTVNTVVGDHGRVRADVEAANLAELADESLEWATATFEAAAETWPRDADVPQRPDTT